MNKRKDGWSHQNKEDIEHESDIQDDELADKLAENIIDENTAHHVSMHKRKTT